MVGKVWSWAGLLLWVCAITVTLSAQEGPPPRVPKVVPVPKPKMIPAQPQTVPEPQDPPPQNYIDRIEKIYFHLSPGWDLTQHDGEMSTFHLDARTAPKNAQLRAVAMLAFNPYPATTFSGAALSFSVIPHISARACEDQTRVKPDRALPPLAVGGKMFWRGLDEHGKICTENRNVTYAAMRRESCLRFDLTVNTFCGGDVSGVEDMTDLELANVFRRLESILDTVEFRDASGRKIERPE